MVCQYKNHMCFSVHLYNFVFCLALKFLRLSDSICHLARVYSCILWIIHAHLHSQA